MQKLIENYYQQYLNTGFREHKISINHSPYRLIFCDDVGRCSMQKYSRSDQGVMQTNNKKLYLRRIFMSIPSFYGIKRRLEIVKRSHPDAFMTQLDDQLQRQIFAAMEKVSEE